jgi:nucleoside-triphosphatase
MENGAGDTTAKKNILLTGRPRVGKSTLVRRVVERLREMGVTRMGGFYTLEVSQGGKRVGFDINTLDGRVGRLAREGFESRHRLGRYGLDMEAFESVAVPALEEAIRQGGLVVIDEIGFMELKSRRFRKRVEEALSSRSPVLATVMRNRFDFPDAIKARGDVMMITVRVENRDRLVEEIVERLRNGMG